MLVPSRTFWHADTASGAPTAAIEKTDEARVHLADVSNLRPMGGS
jgi:hypothetical protein